MRSALIALLTLAVLSSAAAAGAQPAAAEKVRVACVGDSITQGSGYPAELGKLLGPGYEVMNFGVASTTLLSKGERPYVKEKAYGQALAFLPHVVVIMLGTNDTKPQNYKFIQDWVSDYKALIASFAALQTKPKVFLCNPVPVYYDGNWGIDNGRLAEGVLPGIKKVAAETGLPVIDMYTAMSGRPDLFYRDNVHPIGGGLAMAATVHKALTGKDAPVSAEPPPPEQTRVACIGDSITAGSGYAEALQELLGNRFIVRNFGESGTTLLSKGDSPYSKKSKYRAAKDFRPHLAVIMLGTNDTKPQNYKYIAEFEADLKAMIDDLSALQPRPRIILAKPVPVYREGNFGIDNGRLLAGVIPATEKVARENTLPLVDMYKTLSDKPDLFKDNVHPIGAGGLMARTVLAVLRAEIPVQPVRGNLVRNPGFEDGPEPWTTRGGKIEIVTDPVRSGAKALRNTGRTANWHGPGEDVKSALAEKGRGWYNVRASVRLGAGSKPARAQVIIMTSDAGGTRYLGTRDRTATADEWADFDDDVYVSWTGDLKGALLYVQLNGSADADVIVDDFALSAYGAEH